MEEMQEKPNSMMQQLEETIGSAFGKIIGQQNDYNAYHVFNEQNENTTYHIAQDLVLSVVKDHLNKSFMPDGMIASVVFEDGNFKVTVSGV